MHFLEQFWSKYGRAPRILHMGNIANNAYLNAKLLNAAGYDCDVICYDYYHLMGCPEWEDADFDGHIADQNHPDWGALDLGDYQRPQWFVQGPQVPCIDYLVAKRNGQTQLAARLWEQLGYLNKTRRGRRRARIDIRRSVTRAQQLVQATRIWPDAPQRVWSKLELWARARGTPGWLLAACAAPVVMTAVLGIRGLAGGREPTLASAEPGADKQSDLVARFRDMFPERQDQLSTDDWLPYAVILDKWRDLFNRYDIVQSYATDVLYPLLAGKRPYIGFEHGTLRNFTLGDSAICRLTALGYQQADHVFITNGDCLEYAHKIKVRSYTPMIHPIDDRRIASVRGDYATCHEEFKAKYLFVCPLRHDWAVKGTDKYIRALPAIAERIGRNFRVVMTKWGAQLEESKQLAETLGVDELIAWVEPLNRGRLVRLQKSCDIVFDQIALPHFGATAPQALAAGTPTIMSYDASSTTWIVPEPAPILSAWTVAEIVTCVDTALDPAWRASFNEAARQWFHAHHSAARAVRLMSEAYHKVSIESGIL